MDTGKKILAAVFALAAAYLAIKLVFWILGTVLKLAFFAVISMIVLLPVALLAIPLYFYIRRKLLR